MAVIIGNKLGFECLVHLRLQSEPEISHLELPYITPSMFTIGTILKMYFFSRSSHYCRPLTKPKRTPSVTQELTTSDGCCRAIITTIFLRLIYYLRSRFSVKVIKGQSFPEIVLASDSLL